MIPPLDYAPLSKPAGRGAHLYDRQMIEVICAAGAVLSFYIAYTFHLELSTRRAIPTSRIPVEAGRVGVVAFVVALILTFVKGRSGRVWDLLICLCLAVGLAALLLADSPVAWE